MQLISVYLKYTRFYGATIELVRYDPRRSETLDSASVQFWTSDSPKYLANAGTYRQSSEETSETMVVFSPKTPNTTALLQIPRKAYSRCPRKK